ncbi:MAG: SAM-dependent methyltransferase [Cytophagales bacterium CG12_big_fil_rev_8_21_14_0_65_40_12]|nr:MAG: SAM-dependent methyltransferase [Cytophagales bacterium CG12_big_fil_rev_8_21_14_0_65_40_12]PIW05555.1 MAG: SAM-dependent methyltransferase [Cytophagales bacterium CG17_big_fil_post_rev_8_21_14_2_50_40_13]
MIDTFNEHYWTERYATNQIGWDIGHISRPLKEYFDQLTDRSLRILIPGAGNAYEAEYLWSIGFENVHVIDLSVLPLQNIKDRIPAFPSSQLIHGDFFEHSAQYDLIVEQTFFCALSPELRINYVKKMTTLLAPEGKLVGLMFKIPLHTDYPPFGGNEVEYRNLFEAHLKIELMEEAYNSIQPRKGNELFVKLRKLKA